ncbi:MAG: hypothetical protein KGJ57_17605 [Sphingomonadales bacterium]|nr:hypothetical protein [Sphingomonadales bacterium]MDE2171215.1 hypothetical protein [Sphingomonadales bacterium]
MAPASDQYATLEQSLAWARRMMERAPDEVLGVGSPRGEYLRRWYLTPRNPHMNTYLHEIIRSDDERVMHDHPWDNASLIIAGSYREHTPHGSYTRRPGDFVQRQAVDLHRLELIGDAPVISLFTTGEKVREWGFAALQGWVHWREYHIAHGQLAPAVEGAGA